MKVAHLTTVDQSLELLLGAQLSALVAAGHEVIGISAPGPWVKDVERRGVRHVALPSSTRGMDLWADARAILELARILRRERPDVLHTHNPKPGWYGRVVGRLTRTPTVVNTVHGLYATPEDHPLKRGLVYGLEAFASRCSHAELVQNPEDLILIERLSLVPRGRAKLLGNGVALGRFDPSRVDPNARSHVRTELGVAAGQLLVGCVGRLVAEKGYREFIGAAELLPDDFAFVAVGGPDPAKPDSLTAPELARAKAAGIRLVGHRPDVERYYAAMDVFVLASHREGFPRAAMEAAAMGLPVIASDVRGCRQVVEHRINGFLVEVGRHDILADVIRRLGQQPDLRRSMAKASRRVACERFDEARVVKIVMATYEDLEAARGRPSSGLCSKLLKIVRKKGFIVSRIERVLACTKGPDVLDIGCSGQAGRSSTFNSPWWLHGRLLRRFPEAWGLEHSDEGIGRLEEAGIPNVHRGDAQGFKLGKAFDSIVAGEVIEHLENPASFLHTAREHLKPGGRVVLSTPYPFHLGFVLYAWLRFPKTCSNVEHVAWFCPSTMTELAHRSGFRVASWDLTNEFRDDLPRWTGRVAGRIMRAVGPVLPRRIKATSMVFVLEPAEASDGAVTRGG